MIDGRRFRKPYATTLMILGAVIGLVMLMVAWCTEGGLTHSFFQAVASWQQRPPAWLDVSTVPTEHLWWPTMSLMLVVLGVMRCSPQPRPWSRTVVVGIILALTARYVLWRLLATLNVADPINGILSLGLLGAELMLLGATSIQLLLVLQHKDQSRRADQMAIAVHNGTYAPSVDVLIPTYNEPLLILERTLVGCQAMAYPHKTIYILDDTNRPEVAALAKTFDCQYIARSANLHAKAGNLNHAIARTSSELILVFDADFIPTKNFLHRTVGFFQTDNICLVQTPQSYYNPDPVSRNLGWADILNPDEEIFYRYIQPIRGSSGSMVCCGTSFVMRRSALESVGGFVTNSLSEDYFTGIRLSAQGYELVYLNEKLSVGLAAENMETFMAQRARWARGTLQAFFIDSNPLTIPGLNWLQRLSHFEGLLNTLNAFTRLFFLILPIIYAFWDLVPIRFTYADLLYFFLPLYLVQLATYAWLNERSRSALLSDVYWLSVAMPLSATVVASLLSPFSQGFKVSPKGLIKKRTSFNWQLAWPLLLLLAITLVSLVLNFKGLMTRELLLDISNTYRGSSIGLFWSSYNLVMIGIALRSLVEQPKTDPYHWFKLRWPVQIHCEGDSPLTGVTTLVSEQGADLTLPTPKQHPIELQASITLKIPAENLRLQGTVTHREMKDQCQHLQVAFDLSQSQRRQLIRALFCRPGRWHDRQIPGELRATWILLRCLVWPRRTLLRQTQGRDRVVAQS
jgi:cellulose synthase (UDP-forming)